MTICYTETELASVLSLEHNIYVNSLCKSIQSTESCWIGLKRPFDNWEDGNMLSYNNWNLNEPNNYLMNHVLKYQMQLDNGMISHAEIINILYVIILESIIIKY